MTRMTRVCHILENYTIKEDKESLSITVTCNDTGNVVEKVEYDCQETFRDMIDSMIEKYSTREELYFPDI